MIGHGSRMVAENQIISGSNPCRASKKKIDIRFFLGGVSSPELEAGQLLRPPVGRRHARVGHLHRPRRRREGHQHPGRLH